MAAAGDFQCRIGADGDIQRHRFAVQAGQVIDDTERDIKLISRGDHGRNIRCQHKIIPYRGAALCVADAVR